MRYLQSGSALIGVGMHTPVIRAARHRSSLPIDDRPQRKKRARGQACIAGKCAGLLKTSVGSGAIDHQQVRCAEERGMAESLCTPNLTV